jgi:hypothetical protein
VKCKCKVERDDDDLDDDDDDDDDDVDSTPLQDTNVVVTTSIGLRNINKMLIDPNSE